MPVAPLSTLALSAAATALPFAQVISESGARRRQLSAQAAFQQQQAERARAINTARIRQLQRQQSRDFAAGRARLTSAGVVPSLGSALLLQESRAAQDRFDALLAESIGLQSSIDADRSSHLLRLQEGAERQRGLLKVTELALPYAQSAVDELNRYFNRPEPPASKKPSTPKSPRSTNTGWGGVHV